MLSRFRHGFEKQLVSFKCHLLTQRRFTGIDIDGRPLVRGSSSIDGSHGRFYNTTTNQRKRVAFDVNGSKTTHNGQQQLSLVHARRPFSDSGSSSSAGGLPPPRLGGRPFLLSFFLYGTGLLLSGSAIIVLMFPLMDKYFFPSAAVRFLKRDSSKEESPNQSIHAGLEQQLKSRFVGAQPPSLVVVLGEAGSGKSTCK
jgi:hypothetical protein